MSDNIRTNFCPACKGQADRIAELEAENVGLREALAEILEDAHEEAYPHIRAALKEIDNG